MKKFLLILFTCYFTASIAQTTLSPGDIMFVGVNSDATGTPTADEFDVLFLVPVTTGTVIYFTDMGYTGNTYPYFQQNINNGCPSVPSTAGGAVSDGIIKWTATGDVTAGTQLVIRVNITGVNGPTCNVGSVSTVVETQTSGTTINLSSAGEAIHAFQGSINGSNQVTSATMLASLDYDALWTSPLGTCEYSSTKSGNPNTGFEARFATHEDNGYYSGTLTGNKEALQAAILNSSNWTTSSSTPYTFPITGGFTLNNNDFNTKSGELKVYPNPASDMVHINSAVKKVTIYDSLGRQLLETTKSSFSVQSFLSGWYLAQIETEKGIIAKRFIKK